MNYDDSTLRFVRVLITVLMIIGSILLFIVFTAMVHCSFTKTAPPVRIKNPVFVRVGPGSTVPEGVYLVPKDQLTALEEEAKKP